ncbi:Scr1 family TA system antitoxin-like transcriptional regulator [Streptomyces malaysiensis]|uniref:Scr1 family TA system antitoxin-like transcriptional regulator n=1 Tax=Streptomyces malaysiensis TaxID=92644 RepID=UPI0027426DCE|nr:Scr1 family TA system antitoxin-like transcriptional regulator [Streptomyces samsunensis]
MRGLPTPSGKENGHRGVEVWRSATVYDQRLVTVETFTGRIVFQDARDIAEHLAVFDLYEHHALFGEEARSVLGEWAASYRS